MSTPDREAILGRVRAALGALPARAAAPTYDDALTQLRDEQPAGDLWARFTRALEAVHGRVAQSADALADLLAEAGATQGYCEPELASVFAPACEGRIVLHTTFDRERIDDYTFGITRAVGAIAETGTVVLADATTTGRLPALAPWVHVACVRRDTLVPTVADALAVLPDSPNAVWVTGPSKTADIEGVLIEGVHGPGVQVAYLLP